MADMSDEVLSVGERTFHESFSNERKNMRVLFVNNDGGGYADYIELPHGTSVQELFDQKMRGAKAENYLIRINREPAAKDQVLVEGDRVTFTPIKIEGAGVTLPYRLRLAG
jgi:hypothetical protein